MVTFVQPLPACVRRWGLSLCIVGVVFTLGWADASLIQSGSVELLAIQSGEWWRLLSGHFLHLSPTHMLLNVVAYLVVGFIYRDTLRPQQEFYCVVVLSLIVSVGVLSFDESAQWYVGLSGVIHGLVMRGAVLKCFAHGQLGVSLLVIFVVSSKIAGELFGISVNYFGAADIGGVVVVSSHLWGAVGGLLLGLVEVRARQQ